LVNSKNYVWKYPLTEANVVVERISKFLVGLNPVGMSHV
jgi:hypothetical protein